jgi:1-acyl-sn-glycerol-3-phosphate acyltransferase
MAVKRRITFLAKSEYFTRPGFKGALEKFFYTQTGQVPIDRSGADAAEAALNTAKEQLALGRLVGLYPEGTRSPDGRLYKGKTGVARLALDTGLPVIPMAVINTDKVSPPGSGKWHRVQVTVKFGKPMDFSRYAGLAGNRFVERAITDEIMYELMKMSGQTYVDVYAATIKNKKSSTKATADRIPDTRAG